MEALVGVLIGVVVGQGALLWFKIGRVEGILKEHCRQNGSSKGSGKE